MRRLSVLATPRAAAGCSEQSCQRIWSQDSAVSWRGQVVAFRGVPHGPTEKSAGFSPGSSVDTALILPELIPG